MPETKHRPKDLTIDKNKHELRIIWKDGKTSTYPLDQLREACPCASCRGGHEYMGEAHDPDFFEIKPVQTYQITAAEVVGNYALNIAWDDGHTAGIYAWDYLRRLAFPEEKES